MIHLFLWVGAFSSQSGSQWLGLFSLVNPCLQYIALLYLPYIVKSVGKQPDLWLPSWLQSIAKLFKTKLCLFPFHDHCIWQLELNSCLVYLLLLILSFVDHSKFKNVYMLQISVIILIWQSNQQKREWVNL